MEKQLKTPQQLMLEDSSKKQQVQETAIPQNIVPTGRTVGEDLNQPITYEAQHSEMTLDPYFKQKMDVGAFRETEMYSPRIYEVDEANRIVKPSQMIENLYRAQSEGWSIKMLDGSYEKMDPFRAFSSKNNPLEFYIDEKTGSPAFREVDLEKDYLLDKKVKTDSMLVPTGMFSEEGLPDRSDWGIETFLKSASNTITSMGQVFTLAIPGYGQSDRDALERLKYPMTTEQDESISAFLGTVAPGMMGGLISGTIIKGIASIGAIGLGRVMAPRVATGLSAGMSEAAMLSKATDFSIKWAATQNIAEKSAFFTGMGLYSSGSTYLDLKKEGISDNKAAAVSLTLLPLYTLLYSTGANVLEKSVMGGNKQMYSSVASTLSKMFGGKNAINAEQAVNEIMSAQKTFISSIYDSSKSKLVGFLETPVLGSFLEEGWEGWMEYNLTKGISAIANTGLFSDKGDKKISVPGSLGEYMDQASVAFLAEAVGGGLMGAGFEAYNKYQYNRYKNYASQGFEKAIREQKIAAGQAPDSDFENTQIKSLKTQLEEIRSVSFKEWKEGTDKTLNGLVLRAIKEGNITELEQTLKNLHAYGAFYSPGLDFTKGRDIRLPDGTIQHLNAASILSDEAAVSEFLSKTPPEVLKEFGGKITENDIRYFFVREQVKRMKEAHGIYSSYLGKQFANAMDRTGTWKWNEKPLDDKTIIKIEQLVLPKLADIGQLQKDIADTQSKIDSEIDAIKKADLEEELSVKKDMYLEKQRLVHNIIKGKGNIWDIFQEQAPKKAQYEALLKDPNVSKEKKVIAAGALRHHARLIEGMLGPLWNMDDKDRYDFLKRFRGSSRDLDAPISVTPGSADEQTFDELMKKVEEALVNVIGSVEAKFDENDNPLQSLAEVENLLGNAFSVAISAYKAGFNSENSSIFKKFISKLKSQATAIDNIYSIIAEAKGKRNLMEEFDEDVEMEDGTIQKQKGIRTVQEDAGYEDAFGEPIFTTVEDAAYAEAIGKLKKAIPEKFRNNFRFFSYYNHFYDGSGIESAKTMTEEEVVSMFSENPVLAEKLKSYNVINITKPSDSDPNKTVSYQIATPKEGEKFKDPLYVISDGEVTAIDFDSNPSLYNEWMLQAIQMEPKFDSISTLDNKGSLLKDILVNRYNGILPNANIEWMARAIKNGDFTDLQMLDDVIAYLEQLKEEASPNGYFSYIFKNPEGEPINQEIQTKVSIFLDSEIDFLKNNREQVRINASSKKAIFLKFFKDRASQISSTIAVLSATGSPIDPAKLSAIQDSVNSVVSADGKILNGYEEVEKAIIKADSDIDELIRNLSPEDKVRLQNHIDAKANEIVLKQGIGNGGLFTITQVNNNTDPSRELKIFPLVGYDSNINIEETVFDYSAISNADYKELSVISKIQVALVSEKSIKDILSDIEAELTNPSGIFAGMRISPEQVMAVVDFMRQLNLVRLANKKNSLNNTIGILGYQGSGKTSFVMPMIYKLLNKAKPDTKFLFCGANESMSKAISEEFSKDGLLDKTSPQYNSKTGFLDPIGLGNIMADTDSNPLRNKVNEIDFLVIDEYATLPANTTAKNELSKRNPNAIIIAIGDPGQPSIAQTSIIFRSNGMTVPLKANYRTGINALVDFSNKFRADFTVDVKVEQPGLPFSQLNGKTQPEKGVFFVSGNIASIIEKGKSEHPGKSIAYVTDSVSKYSSMKAKEAELGISVFMSSGQNSVQGKQFDRVYMDMDAQTAPIPQDPKAAPAVKDKNHKINSERYMVSGRAKECLLIVTNENPSSLNANGNGVSEIKTTPEELKNDRKDFRALLAHLGITGKQQSPQQPSTGQQQGGQQQQGEQSATNNNPYDKHNNGFRLSEDGLFYEKEDANGNVVRYERATTVAYSTRNGFNRVRALVASAIVEWNAKNPEHKIQTYAEALMAGMVEGDFSTIENNLMQSKNGGLTEEKAKEATKFIEDYSKDVQEEWDASRQLGVLVDEAISIAVNADTEKEAVDFVDAKQGEFERLFSLVYRDSQAAPNLMDTIKSIYFQAAGEELFAPGSTRDKLKAQITYGANVNGKNVAGRVDLQGLDGAIYDVKVSKDIDKGGSSGSAFSTGRMSKSLMYAQEMIIRRIVQLVGEGKSYDEAVTETKKNIINREMAFIVVKYDEAGTPIVSKENLFDKIFRYYPQTDTFVDEVAKKAFGTVVLEKTSERTVDADKAADFKDKILAGQSANATSIVYDTALIEGDASGEFILEGNYETGILEGATTKILGFWNASFDYLYHLDPNGQHSYLKEFQAFLTQNGFAEDEIERIVKDGFSADQYNKVARKWFDVVLNGIAHRVYFPKVELGIVMNREHEYAGRPVMRATISTYSREKGAEDVYVYHPLNNPSKFGSEIIQEIDRYIAALSNESDNEARLQANRFVSSFWMGNKEFMETADSGARLGEFQNKRYYNFGETSGEIKAKLEKLRSTIDKPDIRTKRFYESFNAHFDAKEITGFQPLTPNQASLAKLNVSGMRLPKMVVEYTPAPKGETKQGKSGPTGANARREKFKKSSFSPKDELQYAISQEEATQQIVGLLGEDFFEWGSVGFVEGLMDRGQSLNGVARVLIQESTSDKNSSQARALIELNTINGLANSTTPRHEAFHVVFNMLISPEKRETLLKQVMDMKGFTNALDAEEWLAEQFETKEYQNLVPNYGNWPPLIQSFMRWWSKVHSWFTGQGYYDMKDFLESIDKGEYVNKRPLYIVEEGERYSRVHLSPIINYFGFDVNDRPILDAQRTAYILVNFRNDLSENLVDKGMPVDRSIVATYNDLKNRYLAIENKREIKEWINDDISEFNSSYPGSRPFIVDDDLKTAIEFEFFEDLMKSIDIGYEVNVFEGDIKITKNSKSEETDHPESAQASETADVELSSSSESKAFELERETITAEMSASQMLKTFLSVIPFDRFTYKDVSAMIAGAELNPFQRPSINDPYSIDFEYISRELSVIFDGAIIDSYAEDADYFDVLKERMKNHLKELIGSRANSETLSNSKVSQLASFYHYVFYPKNEDSIVSLNPSKPGSHPIFSSMISLYGSRTESERYFARVTENGVKVGNTGKNNTREVSKLFQTKRDIENHFYQTNAEGKILRKNVELVGNVLLKINGANGLFISYNVATSQYAINEEGFVDPATPINKASDQDLINIIKALNIPMNQSALSRLMKKSNEKFGSIVPSLMEQFHRNKDNSYPALPSDSDYFQMVVGAIYDTSKSPNSSTTTGIEGNNVARFQQLNSMNDNINWEQKEKLDALKSILGTIDFSIGIADGLSFKGYTKEVGTHVVDEGSVDWFRRNIDAFFLGGIDKERLYQLPQNSNKRYAPVVKIDFTIKKESEYNARVEAIKTLEEKRNARYNEYAQKVIQEYENNLAANENRPPNTVTNKNWEDYIKNWTGEQLSESKLINGIHYGKDAAKRRQGWFTTNNSSKGFLEEQKSYFYSHLNSINYKITHSAIASIVGSYDNRKSAIDSISDSDIEAINDFVLRGILTEGMQEQDVSKISQKQKELIEKAIAVKNAYDSYLMSSIIVNYAMTDYVMGDMNGYKNEADITKRFSIPATVGQVVAPVTGKDYQHGYVEDIAGNKEELVFIGMVDAADEAIFKSTDGQSHHLQIFEFITYVDSGMEWGPNNQGVWKYIYSSSQTKIGEEVLPVADSQKTSSSVLGYVLCNTYPDRMAQKNAMLGNDPELIRLNNRWERMVHNRYFGDEKVLYSDEQIYKAGIELWDAIKAAQAAKKMVVTSFSYNTSRKTAKIASAQRVGIPMTPITESKAKRRSMSDPMHTVDMSDGSKVTVPIQFYNALAIGPDNYELSTEINSLLKKMTEEQSKKFYDSISEEGSVSSKKFVDFIKTKLMDRPDDMRIYEFINDNPEISIDIPFIMDAMLRAFASTLNSTAIRPPIVGGHFVLESDWGINVADENGNKFDLLSYEKPQMYAQGEQLPDGTISLGKTYEQYIAELKALYEAGKGEELKAKREEFFANVKGAVKAKVLMPFPYKKYFGLTKKDFVDSDGRYKSVQNIRKYVGEKHALYLSKKLAKSENPPSPEAIAEMVNERLSEFDKAISTFIGIRIPTSGKNSTLLFEIAGFYEDNNNTMIVHKDIVLLHGSDYDVDKLMVMGYDFWKKDSIGNQVLGKSIELLSKGHNFKSKSTLISFAEAKSYADTIMNNSGLGNEMNGIFFLNPAYQQKVASSVYEGGKLVGVEANAIKQLPYLQQAKFKVLPGGKPFTLFGKTFVDYGEGKNLGVDDFMGILLNAAIDTVKENVLYPLNLTYYTKGAYNSLLMMGNNKELVCMLMAQPVLRWRNYLNDNTDIAQRDKENAIAKKVQKKLGEYIASEDSAEEEYNKLDGIETDTAIKLLKESLKFFDKDMNIREVAGSEMTKAQAIAIQVYANDKFSLAQSASKKLSDGILSVFLLNSGINTDYFRVVGLLDRTKSYLVRKLGDEGKDANGLEKSINDILSISKTDMEYDAMGSDQRDAMDAIRTFNAAPHFEQYLREANRFVGEVENTMLIGNTVFGAIEGIIKNMQGGSTITQEKRAEIYKEFYRYLLSKYLVENGVKNEKGEQIFSLSNNLDVSAFRYAMKNMIVAAKNKYPDNGFLELLDSREFSDGGETIYEMVGGIAGSAEEQNLITQDARDLFAMEPNLARCFVAYSLLNQGLSASGKSYSQYIPAKFYKPLSDYIKDSVSKEEELKKLFNEASDIRQAIQDIASGTNKEESLQTLRSSDIFKFVLDFFSSRPEWLSRKPRQDANDFLSLIGEQLPEEYEERSQEEILEYVRKKLLGKKQSLLKEARPGSKELESAKAQLKQARESAKKELDAEIAKIKKRYEEKYPDLDKNPDKKIILLERSREIDRLVKAHESVVSANEFVKKEKESVDATTLNSQEATRIKKAIAAANKLKTINSEKLLYTDGGKIFAEPITGSKAPLGRNTAMPTALYMWGNQSSVNGFTGYFKTAFHKILLEAFYTSDTNIPNTYFEVDAKNKNNYFNQRVSFAPSEKNKKYDKWSLTYAAKNGIPIYTPSGLRYNPRFKPGTNESVIIFEMDETSKGQVSQSLQEARQAANKAIVEQKSKEQRNAQTESERIQDWENVVANISSALPGIEVELVNSQQMHEMGVDPSAFGFKKGNKIYLNTDKATQETAIHEMGHIVLETMKAENPSLYNSILQSVKGTKFEYDVRDRYPELQTEEEVLEEAAAQAIGYYGANPTNEYFDNEQKSFSRKVMRALEKFAKWLKDLVGISDKYFNRLKVVYGGVENIPIRQLALNISKSLKTGDQLIAKAITQEGVKYQRASGLSDFEGTTFEKLIQYMYGFGKNTDKSGASLTPSMESYIAKRVENRAKSMGGRVNLDWIRADIEDSFERSHHNTALFATALNKDLANPANFDLLNDVSARDRFLDELPLEGASKAQRIRNLSSMLNLSPFELQDLSNFVQSVSVQNVKIDIGDLNWETVPVVIVNYVDGSTSLVRVSSVYKGEENPNFKLTVSGKKLSTTSDQVGMSKLSLVMAAMQLRKNNPNMKIRSIASLTFGEKDKKDSNNNPIFGYDVAQLTRKKVDAYISDMAEIIMDTTKKDVKAELKKLSQGVITSDWTDLMASVGMTPTKFHQDSRVKLLKALADGNTDGEYIKSLVDAVTFSNTELAKIVDETVNDIGNVEKLFGYLGETNNPVASWLFTEYSDADQNVKRQLGDMTLQLEKLVKNLMEETGYSSIAERLETVERVSAREKLYDFMWKKDERGFKTEFISPEEAEALPLQSQKDFYKYVVSVVKQANNLYDDTQFAANPQFAPIVAKDRRNSIDKVKKGLSLVGDAFTKEKGGAQLWDAIFDWDEVSPDAGRNTGAMIVKKYQKDSFHLEENQAFDRDVENIVKKYFNSALRYKIMNPIVNDFAIAKSILERRHLSKDGTGVTIPKNVIEQMDAFVKMNVLKVDEDSNLHTLPDGRVVDLDPMLNGFRNYTALTYMSGNLPSIAFNFGIGAIANFSNMMSEQFGGGFVDYWKSFGIVLADITQQLAGKQTKIYHLMRKFNIEGGEYDISKTKDRKIFTTSQTLAPQKWGDYFNKAQIMVDQLMQMNAWDDYDDEGNVKQNGTGRSADQKFRIARELSVLKREQSNKWNYTGNEIYGLDQREIRNLKSTISAIQGRYGDDERTAFEIHAVGKVLMQYKRFFPSLLDRYFMSKRESSGRGEYKIQSILDEQGNESFQEVWQPKYVEGVFNTLFHTAEGIVKGDFRVLDLLSGKAYENDPGLGAARRRNMGKFAIDMGIIAALFVLSKAFDDDEEKRKKSKFLDRMLADSARMYNPKSYFEMVNNPVASFNLISTALSVIGSTIMMERNQEGELKGINNLPRVLPGGNLYRDTKGYLGLN